VDEVKINANVLLTPLPPTSSLLENNFILFPSGVIDYQSNEILFEELRTFIDRYVELPETFLSVVTAYVMMTWLYDKFQNLPYLKVIGLWGCGKTRVLEVMGHLSYKTIMAGGSMTTAALFRTLDVYNGTLVFDEAELNDVESKEMLRVLRQGHNASFSVTRMEATPNGHYYTKSFRVFGPKIIASSSKSNDTAFESRCLSQLMHPLENNTRPIELSFKFKQEALELRNKLLMFRFKNYGQIVVDEKAMEEVKLARLKQTGLAIVSVAKLLGAKPLKDILVFLGEYEKELHIEQADSVESDILICILELLTDDRIRKSGKIRMGSDLAEIFNRRKYEEYSDKPTKEYNSPTQGVLKFQAYKVSPKKIGVFVRKIGLKVERDGLGFYIPVFREYPKIRNLAKRYKLETLFTLPENLMEMVELSTKEDDIPMEVEKNKDEKSLDDEIEKSPESKDDSDK